MGSFTVTCKVQPETVRIVHAQAILVRTRFCIWIYTSAHARMPLILSLAPDAFTPPCIVHSGLCGHKTSSRTLIPCGFRWSCNIFRAPILQAAPRALQSCLARTTSAKARLSDSRQMAMAAATDCASCGETTGARMLLSILHWHNSGDDAPPALRLRAPAPLMEPRPVVTRHARLRRLPSNFGGGHGRRVLLANCTRPPPTRT
jgi:hypothetical protein